VEERRWQHEYIWEHTIWCVLGSNEEARHPWHHSRPVWLNVVPQRECPTIGNCMIVVSWWRIRFSMFNVGIDHDKSVEWHQQIQVRERYFLSVFQLEGPCVYYWSIYETTCFVGREDPKAYCLLFCACQVSDGRLPSKYNVRELARYSKYSYSRSIYAYSIYTLWKRFAFVYTVWNG
jgi:hypothetical protein